jgi:hypothetical protein
MAFGESIYLVTNNESHPISFVFNRQAINIEAGGKSMVPFEALMEKFGDPRSGPEPQPIIVNGMPAGRIMSRDFWLGRLSVTYGVYDPGNLDGYTKDGKHYPGLKELMPKVTIQTLEGDDPGFSWPADDPDCQFLKPNTNSGTSVEENLRRELAEMKRRQLAMEKMLKNRTMPEPSETIPEDTPPDHIVRTRGTQPPPVPAPAPRTRAGG